MPAGAGSSQCEGAAVLNIVGIDPSLTHTAGWHAFGPASGLERRGFAITSKLKDYAHPIARLAAFRTALLVELGRCALNVAPGLAVIENYSFGSANGREALGEWGGQVRLMAYELGWQVVLVPPSTLKAFVTGKGNAPKEQMILSVFKRWAIRGARQQRGRRTGAARAGRRLRAVCSKARRRRRRTSSCSRSWHRSIRAQRRRH